MIIPRMYVLLFRGKGLISTLIRWQTRGEYSHAALQIEHPDGGIYESWQGAGVRRLKNLKSWENVDRYEVRSITSDQIHAVRYFMDQQRGKKYDYVGVLRFVTRRRRGDNEKWFCSELVFEALKSAKIPLFVRTEGWEVSPDMLKRSPRLASAT